MPLPSVFFGGFVWGCFSGFFCVLRVFWCSFGVVWVLDGYCIATGLLEWVWGCFVCWRVEGGGVVLTVLIYRRMMLSDVVVIGKETGDMSPLAVGFEPLRTMIFSAYNGGRL